jgi:hypothetical protein
LFRDVALLLTAYYICFDFVRFIPYTTIYAHHTVGCINFNNEPDGMALMDKNISFGMDLGVYAFCMLVARKQAEWNWQPKDFEQFADRIADNIQRETGMPAEDVALHVIPVLEKAMENIGRKQG